MYAYCWPCILNSYSSNNRLAPLVPERNNCVTSVSVFAVCILKFCEIWVLVSCIESGNYLGCSAEEWVAWQTLKYRKIFYHMTYFKITRIAIIIRDKVQKYPCDSSVYDKKWKPWTRGSGLCWGWDSSPLPALGLFPPLPNICRV